VRVKAGGLFIASCLSILSPRGAPYKNPQRKDTKFQDLYGIIEVVPRIDDLKLDRNQIWGLGKK